MVIPFIVLAIVIVYFVLCKTGYLNSKSDNGRVSQIYESKEGRFVISGQKNNFVITKNENIAFLVKDGQIVACKDKRVGDDFKYYGGK